MSDFSGHSSNPRVAWHQPPLPVCFLWFTNSLFLSARYYCSVNPLPHWSCVTSYHHVLSACDCTVIYIIFLKVPKRAFTLVLEMKVTQMSSVLPKLLFASFRHVNHLLNLYKLTPQALRNSRCGQRGWTKHPHTLKHNSGVVASSRWLLAWSQTRM